MTRTIVLAVLMAFLVFPKHAYADDLYPIEGDPCTDQITVTYGGYEVTIPYAVAVSPTYRTDQLDWLRQQAGQYEANSPLWRVFTLTASVYEAWGAARPDAITCPSWAEDGISSPINQSGLPGTPPGENNPPETEPPSVPPTDPPGPSDPPTPPSEPPVPPTNPPPPPDDPGQRGRDFDPQPEHGKEGEHGKGGPHGR